MPGRACPTRENAKHPNTASRIGSGGIRIGSILCPSRGAISNRTRAHLQPIRAAQAFDRRIGFGQGSRNACARGVWHGMATSAGRSHFGPGWSSRRVRIAQHHPPKPRNFSAHEWKRGRAIRVGGARDKPGGLPGFNSKMSSTTPLVNRLGTSGEILMHFATFRHSKVEVQ